MPNTAASISVTFWSINPAQPIAMIPISAVLTQRITRALSVMSASCPEIADRIKNGRMNNACAMAENCASRAASE